MIQAFHRLERSLASLNASKFALIYLFAGGGWILLSNEAIVRFLGVCETSILMRVEILKGWLFVALTAVTLYLLVRGSEHRLRESQRVLSTLMSNLPGMVYRCQNDQESTMEFVSSGCLDLTGYHPSELIGNNKTSYAQRIHPEDRDRVWNEVQKAIGKRQAFQLTYRIETAQGKQKWVWEQGRGVFSEKGELLALEGFIADITERKNLEEQFRQAQKMEAVGQLAGSIAHDFNNLLAVIMGYSELALDRLSPGEELRRHLDEIKRAADRASSLTRQLLAFSRKQVLAPATLDINSTVREMDKMLERLIGEDIELAIVTRPRVGKVKADRGQIEQVILNLVVNARDAMPQGGKLTIETADAELEEEFVSRHPYVRPGHYVTVIVADSGNGMDSETQKHIFEPFFTTKRHGTGLGLATVYGVVKQSGGYIWVESQPGQGAKFKVYLPRVEAEADVSGTKREGGLVYDLQGSETVLLVEDQEPLRKLVGEFLRSNGYAVLEARDAAEALKIATEHPEPIHLLLTDVVMPKMSGSELAIRLATLRSEIKVLYISGHAGDVLGRHGIVDASMSFLQKPFTREALLRKVRGVLDSPLLTHAKSPGR